MVESVLKELPTPNERVSHGILVATPAEPASPTSSKVRVEQADSRDEHVGQGEIERAHRTFTVDEESPLHGAVEKGL